MSKLKLGTFKIKTVLGLTGLLLWSGTVKASEIQGEAKLIEPQVTRVVEQDAHYKITITPAPHRKRTRAAS